MYCAQCGHLIPDDSLFCPECNAPVEDVEDDETEGFQDTWDVQDNWDAQDARNFQDVWNGQPAEGLQVGPAPAPEAEPTIQGEGMGDSQQEKNRTLPIAIAAIGIVAIIAIVCIVFFSSQKEPEPTSSSTTQAQDTASTKSSESSSSQALAEEAAGPVEYSYETVVLKSTTTGQGHEEPTFSYIRLTCSEPNETVDELNAMMKDDAEDALAKKMTPEVVGSNPAPATKYPADLRKRVGFLFSRWGACKKDSRIVPAAALFTRDAISLAPSRTRSASRPSPRAAAPCSRACRCRA